MGGFVGGGGGTFSGGTLGSATLIDVDAQEAFLVREDGDAGDIFVVDTVDGVVAFGGAAPVTGNRITLPLEDEDGTPTIGFGDGDSGIYESADDTLKFVTAGVQRFAVNSNGITATVNAGVSGFGIMNEIASATNPTLVPRIPDFSTGVGSSGSSVLNLIAGGVETAGFRATGNHTIDSLLDVATGNEVALDIQYTTNKSSSGDDTGLVVNQTDTDSPGTSLIIDCQVGGTSVFSVDNAGLVQLTGYLVLDITDTDGTVEGSIWYDASEDKLKFKTAAGVETITSA